MQQEKSEGLIIRTSPVDLKDSALAIFCQFSTTEVTQPSFIRLNMIAIAIKDG
jgi:hypothetical protein